MTKRMLIDASHPEECRVVIADERQIAEFDFVTTAKKLIKGNIYLAKITRVEPSLQAAFVEYGSGKQGFLPFAEIHPDYYQIPMADRQRLLAEAEAEAAEEEAAEDAADTAPERGGRGGNAPYETAADGRAAAAEGADGSYTATHYIDAPASGDATLSQTTPFAGEADTLSAAAHESAAIAEDVDTRRLLPSFLDKAVSVTLAGEEEENFPETAYSPYGKTAAPAAQPERAPSFIVRETPGGAPVWDAAAAGSAAQAAPLSAGGEGEYGDRPVLAADAAVPHADSTADITQAQAMQANMPQDVSSHIASPFAEAGEGERNGDVASSSAVTDGADSADTEQDDVETLANEEGERRPKPRRSFLRRYKIQEVIKRGQIVLVQVIKEERGNKGASLSTYISLAGRYCVLMPNSPRAGGISRKIGSGDDRRRLKQISSDLRVSAGMSAIIRTAGIDRSRAEIKRDFDYLVTLWNSIRELTLASTAPALIYEEGDLIKRSIRDLYQSDIEEVWVEGEAAFHDAKEFMKMLLPSHAPRVKLFKDSTPLFYAYGVEDQLTSMHEPVVRLRSGGYIVISPTEALISIDVNSGRATGERNIEETAYKTNLEAATEIARQLRLRDLAGLIVIDFIDMGDSRNRRQIERVMKDELRHDRAKIQVGRISPFGLLEMSRQRLRPSISETSTITCPQCVGRGVVRAPESVSIQLIRALEKEAGGGNVYELRVSVPTDLALYLFNQKRDAISQLERQFEIKIILVSDDSLLSGNYRIERGKQRQGEGGGGYRGDASAGAREDSGRGRGRGRRRGGAERHRDGQDASDYSFAEQEPAAHAGSNMDEATPNDATSPAGSLAADGEEGASERGRRPRRTRGGRNRRDRGERGERGERTERTPIAYDSAVGDMPPLSADEGGVASSPMDAEAGHEGQENADRPRRTRGGRRERGGRGRRNWKERGDAAAGDAGNNGNANNDNVSGGAAAGYSGNAGQGTSLASYAPSVSHAPHSGSSGEGAGQSDSSAPKKRGWWRRIVES